MTVVHGSRHLLPLLLLVMVLWLFPPVPGEAHDHFRVVATADSELPFSETDRLFLSGDYAAARDRLDTLLTTSDVVAAAHLANRALLMQLLDEGDGIALLRRAHAAEPDHFLTAWALGRALLDADSLAAAEAILRVAQDNDDRYGESAIDLARCLRLRGKLDEAENLLEALLDRPRSDGDAYAELARVHLARQRFEEQSQAMDILAAGLEQFPYEPVLRLYATRLADVDRSEQAVQVAQQYLELYPRSSHAAEMAGVISRLAPDSLQLPDGYDHSLYENGEIPSAPGELLPLGRRVRWSAKWGLIRLGELTTEVMPDTYEGDSCWVARYTASATTPFVTLADTFYAWIDRDLRYTHRLDMIYHEGDENSRKTLENDYSRGASEVRIWEPTGHWWYDALPLPPNLFDPSSQLWYTQQLVAGRQSGRASVAIDHTLERTEIRYGGVDGSAEVDGRRTDLHHVHGVMPYSGLAGLNGVFEAWYGRIDGLLLPVRTRFKIFLGSVTLHFDDVTPGQFDPRAERDLSNHPLETDPAPAPGPPDSTATGENSVETTAESGP